MQNQCFCSFFLWNTVHFDKLWYNVVVILSILITINIEVRLWEKHANANDKGYRIIAVDDEEGIVDSLSIFLKRSGYDFTGVTDPMEAIEKVKMSILI